jgi:hypothetical protein
MQRSRPGESGLSVTVPCVRGMAPNVARYCTAARTRPHCSHALKMRLNMGLPQSGRHLPAEWWNY